MRSFQARWRHRVKVRKPTNIKRSRAKVSAGDVKAFIQRIKPELEGVPRYCIFNFDESPFCDNPAAEDAFFGSKAKHCEKVQNHSKTSFSVMFCCSAAGDLLPPMTVYKSGTGCVFPSWGEGGPEGSVYAANKSGYFDMDKYLLWFKDVFLVWVNKELPREQVKVLIGDNLAAHFCPAVTTLCEENNIRYIFLPENSTHILQPLDTHVFGPMKRRWRSVVSDWKDDCASRGENYATIPKQIFPTLLARLLEKNFSACIRSGFEGTGLYPVSVERATSKLPADVDDRQVESDVQRELLRTLSNMRHNQPANKHAQRPKQKTKLPAGASYTCSASAATVPITIAVTNNRRPPKKAVRTPAF